MLLEEQSTSLPTQTMLMESGSKRGKVLVNTDEKNRGVYGDDFNYYSAAKSYNLAMPRTRHEI